MTSDGSFVTGKHDKMVTLRADADVRVVTESVNRVAQLHSVLLRGVVVLVAFCESRSFFLRCLLEVNARL